MLVTTRIHTHTDTSSSSVNTYTHSLLDAFLSEEKDGKKVENNKCKKLIKQELTSE